MKKRLGLALGATFFAACDRAPAPPERAPTVTAPPPPASVSVSGAVPQAPATSASASPLPPPSSLPSTPVTFDESPVGGSSPAFEAAVGDWHIAEEGGARGLLVDGSKWKSGAPAFPLAIYTKAVPPGDLRVAVRFYPLAGNVDQAAGIAFSIAPDASYLAVRANALEDNLLYFKVVNGKRTVLAEVAAVPTPKMAWHALALELRGKHISVELDGKRRFERDLDAAPSGRIGLWSKADSRVLFDDFAVTPL